MALMTGKPRTPIMTTLRSNEMLCSDCSRWHDRTGRPLLGWQSNDGRDRRWPLPKGHRPPNYTVDAGTGWEPIHGTCAAVLNVRPLTLVDPGDTRSIVQRVTAPYDNTAL